ncbi:MAG: DUF58 domain-containing protein [Gallionellaceae bacterium]|nr:DUF58 domain-containing protein [Gallionellaceae bacterium]
MLKLFKQKFRNWAFRRTVETGTVVLNQRRIYILPTRQGIGFAIVLVLMLLGDINYNLSLGYTLTFLLATAGGMSMLHAFRNMAQLEIHAGYVEPVFVGEDASFVFHFNNPGTLSRYQLQLHDDAAHRTIFDLAAQRSTPIYIAIPAKKRGWLDSGRLTLHTHYPFGLFNAWSYLHFDVRCLVYPKPAPPQALPAASAQNGEGKFIATGDEDFSGLRSYVAGDALPRIAWKTLAREQELQVKQFTAQQGKALWLDWTQLANLGTEAKLALLARWVIDAEAQGLHYGLRLPSVVLAAAHGQSHQAECLKALALFGVNTQS